MGTRRARAALRRTTPERLRPTFGGYPAPRAPPCIRTFLSGLAEKGFFSSLLDRIDWSLALHLTQPLVFNDAQQGMVPSRHDDEPPRDTS
jgi:hypothetical protein